MDDVLNNPVWNALISGNKYLANGSETVKYFAKNVSPFVALETNSAENFNILANLITAERVIIILTPIEIEMPGQWKVLQRMDGFQMVYNGNEVTSNNTAELVTLTDEHIPQMLALTKLTNPGPFASRTIDFGYYKGIFEGDKLVAMAGQRMHPAPYAEVSAVCTHPNHLGKGYARQLLIHHINRIKQASETPFLHVRYDNERAIKVYKDIGFITRTKVYFYIMQKATDK